MTITKETKERAAAYVKAKAKTDAEQQKDSVTWVDNPFSEPQGRNYTQAKKLAVKLIKMFEGCSLFSYPDAASDLYKALASNGMLKAYMNGTCRTLPENFEALDGNPYTCGYGRTKGVTKDTVVTLEQAESALFATVEEVLGQVLKASPALATATDNAIAAVVSFIFNVGIGNYSQSTLCKKIAAGDMLGAAAAFGMWTMAKGNVLQGLVKRRDVESKMFLAA